MDGGGGGAAPAGAFSNNPKASASVYQPTAQPAFDTAFQNILGGLFPQAQNPGTTPGGQAYATAQPAVGAFAGSPYGQQAVDAAQNANYAYGGLFPQADYYGKSLMGAGSNLLTAAQSDPFFQNLMTGSQNAAQADINAGNTLTGNAVSILNTAFDPQQALYTQLFDSTKNRQNAINAFSGVGNTPYGASVTGQTLGDLGINWENAQLGRQTQGLSAAMPALTTGAGLFTQAASLPSNAYLGEVGNLERLQSGAGNLIGQGLNMGTQAAQGLSTFGAGPQNAAAGNISSLLQALGSQTNLGNSQYLLPQQVMNDLQSYLQLGQSSSNISGQLGNLGLNQQQNAFQGLGSLAGNALGSNGPFSSGGALSNLFGGGGAGGVGSGFGTVDSLAAEAGSPSLASLGLEAPFSGAGDALAFAGPAAGGSDFLASAAPLALSA